MRWFGDQSAKDCQESDPISFDSVEGRSGMDKLLWWLLCVVVLCKVWISCFTSFLERSKKESNAIQPLRAMLKDTMPLVFLSACLFCSCVSKRERYQTSSRVRQLDIVYRGILGASREIR